MTHPAARPAAEVRDAARRAGLVRAAGVLREVAGYDAGLDLRRAEVTAAHAALLEACARHLAVLPTEVAARAQSVAAALDHAIGRRGDA